MGIGWKNAFKQDGFPWKDEYSLSEALSVSTISDLKRFLDSVHIKHGLLKPYFETANYPVVEPRELLPSFDCDIWEYKDLPGFSLVVLARPLSYFSEVFQYDALYPVMDAVAITDGASCPLESQIISKNVQTFTARLPRAFQDAFRQKFGHVDFSVLDYYPALQPQLLGMDRGQVIAKDNFGLFHLAGIFASFPSDIDSELKRFGMRIGKFVYGDNALYERNRIFVYQYLMELYGFPIVSERRTSSAIFARKLHKCGENFLLRVLGQTDRAITTYYNDGETRHYPHVEKIALVRVDEDQYPVIEALDKDGFFLDREKRVVILRVKYRQHRFNDNNVRQDRALSVASQEVIHPLTGRVLENVNIIKDTNNMFLRFNDIVRGEYTGKIVYKRTEVVENTDTEEKRLKFLYAWMTKHQRRLIGYSDEFSAKIRNVLEDYLFSRDHAAAFEQHRELYAEVRSRFSYIMQARKVHILEDLAQRRFKGESIGYKKTLAEAVDLLTELKFEVSTYFAPLVDSIIAILEGLLSDSYLTRNYVKIQPTKLTPAGQEIRKNYTRLVSLLDDFKAVRKARPKSK